MMRTEPQKLQVYSFRAAKIDAAINNTSVAVGAI